MSYWNGTGWVPDPAAHPPEPGRTQRAGDWLATLLMVLLMPAMLLVMAGGVLAVKPDSTGHQEYSLGHSGFRVWAEPYAYADFVVTRSRVDNTEVWVKAHCVDANGVQAIPGADPYGYVWWDAANPSVGWATLDSVVNGTTCDVWLTRSFDSPDAAPGWPETHLNINW